MPKRAPSAMPWIPVDQDGAVANLLVPEDALWEARNHTVRPEDLEGKRQGETWTVTFGAERSGCPSTAAWYKVLSVPCEASGRHTWKIGVSYWTVAVDKRCLRYRRQWLLIFPRIRTWDRTCVMAFARDYFLVNLPEQNVP